MEYYSRPIGFFERIRQIEETADQILLMNGPVCYLTTSDSYDGVLAQVFEEIGEGAPGDRAASRAVTEQVLGIQAARKRMHGMRRPSIICMIAVQRVQHFLEAGVAASLPLGERMRRVCRTVAAAEVAHIAGLMEAEPMGLQFGVLTAAEPTGDFAILRARDRATLAVNTFRPDGHPSTAAGVAMITGADEAVAAHQRVAETLWRESLKGSTGAARLRQIIGDNRAE